jgi:hypothetical protein
VGLTLPIAQPQLFNTPLEAGVRALLILDAFAPQAFDLATMSLLDYYIVHTGDAGGPPSLHPEINARAGEYFVRRHLVEEGLLLMARASLVEQVFTGSGIAFRAHETAINTPASTRPAKQQSDGSSNRTPPSADTTRVLAVPKSIAKSALPAPGNSLLISAR